MGFDRNSSQDEKVELREARTGRVLRQWTLPFSPTYCCFDKTGNAFYAFEDGGKSRVLKIRAR